MQPLSGEQQPRAREIEELVRSGRWQRVMPQRAQAPPGNLGDVAPAPPYDLPLRLRHMPSGGLTAIARTAPVDSEQQRDDDQRGGKVQEAGWIAVALGDERRTSKTGN